MDITHKIAGHEQAKGVIKVMVKQSGQYECLLLMLICISYSNSRRN